MHEQNMTNSQPLSPSDLDQVRHLFISGDRKRSPLVLLHGTGGDETTLIEVAQFLAPDHPILAIRGRVVENGYYRYFKRQAVGVFDLVSLAEETQWLVAAITGLAERYQLNVADMTAVGFSNGANIAVHALLTQPQVPFQQVMALHAMQVAAITAPQNLDGTPVFLSYGTQDPLISPQNFAAMRDNLHQAGADLSIFQTDGSHNLTNAELQAAQTWFKAQRRDV